MIYDRLERIGAYRNIHPNLDQAIDYILATDLDTLEEGRHGADESPFYVLAQAPELKAENRWERHRTHIDVQIALADGETIGYAPEEETGPWSPWDDGADFASSESPDTGIPLRMSKGSFAVFFPQDAHRPCLGKGKTRKIVVKVAV